MCNPLPTNKGCRKRTSPVMEYRSLVAALFILCFVQIINSFQKSMFICPKFNLSIFSFFSKNSPFSHSFGKTFYIYIVSSYYFVFVTFDYFNFKKI